MSAAEQARGRYVRLADRAARLLCAGCACAGLVTFLGWLARRRTAGRAALTVAIAVLIITCPCALALAVPAVQVAATSRLFGKGVLVKAADGLERLAEIDTVVFDKTGTLTLGEPALADSDRRLPTPCSRARRSLAAAQPPSLCARRGARGRGRRSRGRARRRRARGRGLRARAHRTGLASSGWARRPGAAPTAPARDAAAVWYRVADGTTTALALRGPAAVRCRPTSSGACIEAGFAHGAAVRRPAAVVEAAATQSGIGRWTAGVLPAQKIARIEALKAAGAQGADGRRRPQRCAGARRRACLALAVDGGRHQPDGRRCRVPGRAAGAGAGDARRRARRAPHGAAELRHRHRLQCGVRAAGHGGARHAAAGRHRHVGLLDRRHRQRRAAQEPCAWSIAR